MGGAGGWLAAGGWLVVAAAAAAAPSLPACLPACPRAPTHIHTQPPARDPPPPQPQPQPTHPHTHTHTHPHTHTHTHAPPPPRYTHLIDVDYFSDLVDVFKQLLAAHALPLAERLRCLLTATELLRGQGEALTIDRRDFYVRLYGLAGQVGLVAGWWWAGGLMGWGWAGAAPGGPTARPCGCFG